jgi:hypothetical protein
MVSPVEDAKSAHHFQQDKRKAKMIRRQKSNALKAVSVHDVLVQNNDRSRREHAPKDPRERDEIHGPTHPKNDPCPQLLNPRHHF